MLREQIGRLGKHSTIYGLSNVLGASATLVLLPLLTRHLSPGQYGMLEVLTVFAAQLGVLFQLGLGSALFKFALRPGQDAGHARLVISTAYLAIGAVTLLATVAMLPFAPQLGHILLGQAEHASLVRWLLAKVLFDALGVVPMVRLRMREASFLYGGLSAGRVFASLLFVFVALLLSDDALSGVVIAMAAESFLFAFLSTATAARELVPRISRVDLRAMLAFGLPLIPYAFGLTILALGDRYFLRLFGGLGEVGAYAVGSKLAAILSIPVRAFQIAWPSFLFSMATARNGQMFYAKILTYLLLLLGFCGIVVSVFARELIQLLATPAFGKGYIVVPILIIAQISLGAFYVTAVGTNLTGKTYLQTMSVGVALLVFGAAAVLLVPGFGMVGAACATALGYLTLAIINCVFSLRLYPVPYEWRRIELLTVCVTILTGLGMRIQTGTRVVDIALKLAVVATYPALLFVLSFFSPSERASLRALLNRASASSRLRTGESAIQPSPKTPNDPVRTPE